MSQDAPDSEIAPVASTSTDIILDPVPTPASLPVESNGDDALSGLLPQDEFVAVVEEEAGEGVAPIVGTSELAKPNLEEGEEDQTGMVIERERSRSIPAPSPVATRVQTPPPAAPTVEELASKKRKADAADVEAKKRGRRMFGLLQGTLNKAKDQTAQLSRTTQKRQELEERLTLKLAKERTEMEEKRVQGKAAKDLDHEINTKENEIASLDGLYQIRHAAKSNLASFLCTTFTPVPIVASSDNVTIPFAAKLPHAMRLSQPITHRPIYYLPYKLTAAQEDLIEDQIIAAERAIKDHKTEWNQLKKTKLTEISEAKSKRSALLDVADRERRVARQAKREEEERLSKQHAERVEADKAAAALAKEIEAVLSPSNDDVMIIESQGGSRGESPMISIRGTATGAEDEDDMDDVIIVGEEAIEY